MNTNGHRRSTTKRNTRPPSGPRTVTTTRPAAQAQGRYNRICGGHGLGETPGPIPNPEAKTQHGNGTALGRVWESSTPPLHNSQGAPHGTRRDGAPFTYPNTNTHPEAHPAPTPPQARHDTNGDHQTDPEPCGHYQRCLGSGAGTLPGVGLCVYATRGPSTLRAQHRSRHQISMCLIHQM